jgi:hypothetical protein
MRKQKLAEELRQEAAKELTFSPKINDYPFKEERPEFLLTVEADTLQRQQRQRELEIKYSREELQFNRPSPKIGERSQAYVEKWQKEEAGEEGAGAEEAETELPAHEKVFSTAGYWKRRAEKIEERTKRHDAEDHHELDRGNLDQGHVAYSDSADGGEAAEGGNAPMMTVEESLYRDAEERRTRLQAVQDAVAQQERVVRESSKMNPRSVGLAARKHERHLQALFEILVPPPPPDATETTPYGLTFGQLGAALVEIGLLHIAPEQQRGAPWGADMTKLQQLWHWFGPEFYDGQAYVSLDAFVAKLLPLYYPTADILETDPGSDENLAGELLALEFCQVNLLAIMLQQKLVTKSSLFSTGVDGSLGCIYHCNFLRCTSWLG